MSDEKMSMEDEFKIWSKQTHDNVERIEALENHDIFKIWTSVRKGGKTTLDAILNDHQRITALEKGLDWNLTELQKQITELRNDIKNIHEWNTTQNQDLDKIDKRIDEFQENLDTLDGAYERHENQIAEMKEKLPEPSVSITPTGYLNAITNKLPKFIEDGLKEESEPEKFDLREFIDVAYDLAQPRKTKGLEDAIIIEFNKDNDTDYILIKRDHDKLIEEFLSDLKNSDYYWKVYRNQLIEKWQGRIK